MGKSHPAPSWWGKNPVRIYSLEGGVQRVLWVLAVCWCLIGLKGELFSGWWVELPISCLCSTPKFLWLTAWGLEEALIFDWWDVGTGGSPRAVGQCDPEALFGATLENCNTNADAELTVGGLLGGLGTLSFHIHVVWSVHIHPQTRVQSRWLENGWPFYQGIWNILSRTANSSLEIIAMCTQYLLSSYNVPST